MQDEDVFRCNKEERQKAPPVPDEAAPLRKRMFNDSTKWQKNAS